MSQAQEPVDVFLIVGSGRCGSTLLDRLLGQSPDIVSAGELKYLWTGLTDSGRRCGCGEPVAQCAFWQAVLERAYGGIDKVPAGLGRAQRWIDQGYYAALLALVPFRPRALTRDLASLKYALARLFPAIAEVAGVKAVVDSSKTPRGNMLASLPGVRLHAIHLVRDSRAVAFSWQRPTASGYRMIHRSLVRSALDWWRINAGAWFLRRRWGDYVRIRYEDLVANPAETVARLAARAGLSAPRLEGEGLTVELPVNHLVGGNPMRFQHGTVQIVEDDEWKEKMPAGDRLLVTLLTWPLLLRYGYPLALAGGRRRRVGKRRGATDP